MSYFTLHTTDGSSTGENVDPVAALGNNFDAIDSGLQSGYQAFNTGTAPAYTNGEIGQAVFPSYIASGDTGGAKLWVFDGTNWHQSDQEEVWGSWLLLPVTDTAHQTNGGAIRLSNFNRVEIEIDSSWASAGVPNNKGLWTTFYDPNLVSAGSRIPASYAPSPNLPNPHVVLGGIGLTSDNTGRGEMVRWAFDTVTISTSNFLRIRYCYTDVTTSSFGPQDIMLHTIYEAAGVSGNGYAGVLN